MKALMQRVRHASVVVGGEVVGEIERGLLVFLGLEKPDTVDVVEKMIQRLLAYRIFADGEEKMNRSLADVRGGLLLVSQFTLAADTKEGLRPGFSSAAPPGQAEPLFDHSVQYAREKHATVAAGVFGADMQIALLNDGPVTFLLEM